MGAIALGFPVVVDIDLGENQVPGALSPYAGIRAQGTDHVGEGCRRGGIQRVVGVEEVLAVIAEGGETRRQRGIGFFVREQAAFLTPGASQHRILSDLVIVEVFALDLDRGFIGDVGDRITMGHTAL